MVPRHARDVMRADAPVVRPSERLSHAAERMATFGVRELAVVDDGVLVGIVTRTDLEPYVGHLEWTAVRVAMTPEPRTVAPDAPIARVAETLIDGRWNGVPVVQEHSLMGMISRQDLLRALVPNRGPA